LIKFININKRDEKDKSIILKDINLSIDEGEFVYIVGESGAGKTSLLKMLYKEMKPNTGQILVRNIDITKISKKETCYYRRKLGIVFQKLELLEKRSIFKNIAYPLEIIGISKKEINERITEILKFMQLLDKKDFIVEKLSEGEKHRVAIARAIINNPDILICDEIIGNLNKEMIENVMVLLTKLNAEGTTIIFSTHNKEFIQKFPKRVIELHRGVKKYV